MLNGEKQQAKPEQLWIDNQKGRDQVGTKKIMDRMG